MPSGSLRELDRAEPEQDRHEVDGGQEHPTLPPPGKIVVADPVEDGGAARERQAGEQRAARAPDAEGHREREPEQADERRGGRVGDRAEVEQPRNTPPKPAIPADRANSRTFVRFDVMPDACAATSELRTASVARPDADRSSAWMTR